MSELGNTQHKRKVKVQSGANPLCTHFFMIQPNNVGDLVGQGSFNSSTKCKVGVKDK